MLLRAQAHDARPRAAIRWSAASTARRAWSRSGAGAGRRWRSCFVVLMLPVFLPYGALLNAAFSKIRLALGLGRQRSRCTTSTSRSSSCRRPSSRLQNTFLLGSADGDLGTILALVIAYLTARRAVPGHRMLGFLATAPIAIPGIVLGVGLFLSLHAAAAGALRHAVDPADRLRHDRAAGGLSAAAVGVPRRASRTRGGEPHPRRHPAAGAARTSPRRCCAPA